MNIITGIDSFMDVLNAIGIFILILAIPRLLTGPGTNAGITAGALAAIVATLVSLPLKSPDDPLFNSATVAIASILVGVLAGLIWRMLANAKGRRIKFAILWGVSSVTVGSMLISAFAIQLDNLVPFALPLVIIVCVITGMLTPVLGHRDPPSDGIVSLRRMLTPVFSRTSSLLRWWVAPVAVTVALALAIPLANVGDEESGRLELPPKSGLVPQAPSMYLETI